MWNERLNANFYVKDTFVKTNGCDFDFKILFYLKTFVMIKLTSRLESRKSD